MLDMKRLSLHPFYPIWNAMNQRCNNPRNAQYKHYGAIGITVCEEWLPPKEKGFVTFLRDMVDPYLLPGESYFDPYFCRGLTLDRRFGPAGYSKENCRWVSPTVQTLNRRSGNVKRSLPQGVKFDKRNSKFYAYYDSTEGKTVTLGNGTTLLEAASLRKSWEIGRYKELGELMPTD